ncbi:MAG: transketolase [Nitrospira sp.]|nr:transketolase [Nitrospira sp.]
MEYEAIARRIRAKLVELSHTAKTAHLGSSLSCVDILVALYWGVLRLDIHQPFDEARDRFILSKGHAATSLYAVLAERGFFPKELLDSYASPGSRFSEHPIRGAAPGIEVTSGSLGHGLPLAVGMALAGRIRNQDFRVVVVLSDGECNEGSVWEAALLAAAQGLERLMVIVDYNKWQATGRSEEVMSIRPLAEKWKSFGWSTYEVDGHDIETLFRVLSQLPDGSGKPVAVVANTVKGKGISFMEDDNNWHYRIPNSAEVQRARQELGLL